MPRQAIRQAACIECGEDEDNHTVSDSDMSFNEDDEPIVEYETRCECGHEGRVVLSDTGITFARGVSHDDASWNQEDEEDSDDE